ncbi:MAG: LPXTG cell wall anchor domain-containing protein [Eubacteriaceae bacterium]
MRKKWIKCVMMFCCFLLIFGTGSAMALESKETVPTIGEEGTDVLSHVIVDYMGKVRFVVRDKNTLEPIEGASIEIFVKSLNRYVLFGLSDSNGVYELDIVYGDDPLTGERFEEINGQTIYKGSLAYVEDSQILWQVYKKDYLPYPEKGEFFISMETFPKEIDVYLYQENTDKNPEKDKITNNNRPKTGVEMQWNYLFIGIALLVVGIIVLLWVLRKNKKENKN